MLNLLKFEINRSKKTILFLVAIMTLFGALLLLINTDHEEIVITISILRLIIPFLLIIIMDLVHIKQDLRLNTKNLYLTTPKTTGNIIGSKIGFAMMNYALFFIMILIFKGVTAIGSYVPDIVIALIVLGIIIELTVLLFNMHSKK